MAGKIDINFDDVPDQIVPIAPGVYDFRIDSATEEEAKSGKGMKLVLEMTCVSEGPEEGRKLYDHISFKMKTQLKRLMKSAGLKPGSDGLDIGELEGKIVNVKVKSRTYTDDSSGETRETSAVGDYLFKE